MRRRPFRPNRRFPRGINQRPQVHPLIAKAHQLFAAGEYQQAADLYLELAKKSEARSLPRTGSLYARAAAAFAKCNEIDKSKDTIANALEWHLKEKQFRQLKTLSEGAITRARKNQQKEISEFIEEWVTENVPDEIKTLDIWQTRHIQRKETVKFPSHCKNCGGPVNPNELDWFDSTTPVCNYCACVIET